MQLTIVEKLDNDPVNSGFFGGQLECLFAGADSFGICSRGPRGQFGPKMLSLSRGRPFLHG
jgi:hypothetical protein